MSNQVFELMKEMEHEQVVFCHDPKTNLKAIIAIHNTTLGPALGGTRMWNYASDDAAVMDALRLSRGMTYKAAISGLNLGGGKAVIIGDPALKSEALWRRYGKFVNSLNGKYITAEDVNTSAADMEHIYLETKHVTGIPEYMGGSGDPSPFTAYGVFMGMKACAYKQWGSDDLSGKRVLVQGVGHVGQYLVGHLVDAGAKVYITDINQERIKETTDKYKAEYVSPDDMLKIDIDIYAPCALGATVNSETIPLLKCPVIAGAANNQLADEKIHGRQLIEKGIIYAPDFLINAGGLINVAAEASGSYNREKVTKDVEKIYNRILDIFALSEKENITTQEAAIRIAQKRMDDVAHVKSRL
ncbi:MAG TPA: Glu/Leu/Phe/Val dehydrogenase dimerization domain-containing protein [Chitinophagaceae bacterium]|nr:Glu/Leu/Phe/Val dehydrogenase dimerization domain-containing protein [Chitinophagaceae bacterium]